MYCFVLFGTGLNLFDGLDLQIRRKVQGVLKKITLKKLFLTFSNFDNHDALKKKI